MGEASLGSGRKWQSFFVCLRPSKRVSSLSDRMGDPMRVELCSHDERYLRVYCRAHNRLSAERVYGVALIQEKIQASRRRSSPSGHPDSS